MRIRTIVMAGATALLLAAMSPAEAAEAGTGTSMQCSDGSGGTEHVVDDTIVTIAVEEQPGVLVLCYSTAGSGVDGQVTGGQVAFKYAWTAVSPAALAALRCTTDYQFGVAPECDAYAIAITDATDVTVTPYPNYVCVLWVNSVCQAHAPGATVWTDASSAPLLYVDTFAQSVAVNPPGQCVALFVTPCP